MDPSRSPSWLVWIFISIPTCIVGPMQLQCTLRWRSAFAGPPARPGIHGSAGGCTAPILPHAHMAAMQPHVKWPCRQSAAEFVTTDFYRSRQAHTMQARMHTRCMLNATSPSMQLCMCGSACRYRCAHVPMQPRTASRLKPISSTPISSTPSLKSQVSKCLD